MKNIFRLFKRKHPKEKAKHQTIQNSFSLAGASSLSNPYPLYAEARATNAVCFEPHDRSWSILNYERVSWALKNSDLFSNQFSAAFDPFLAGSDGMVHAQTRKALTASVNRFQPSAIAGFTENWMDHFLSTKARQSAFDAVWDFAIPLPREFMARLLGLSMAEKERIEEVLSANRTDMNSALAPVGEVLSGIFQEIKKTPRDGLCSDLLHAPQEQALDEEAILSTVRHLWFAGTVTLTGLLPAAVLELCKSPPLREQLAENQEKIPAFISEVLRLEPPAQFVPRMAARDIEIEGMHIPPNAMVRLFLAAANRDPAEFQNPNEIDLDRIPYRHLAFGSGEHFCLGALIAKTISTVSIQRIATELPRLRRGDASELRYEKSPTFRALATLPVLAS